VKELLRAGLEYLKRAVKSEKQNENEVKSRIKNAALALFFILLFVPGVGIEPTLHRNTSLSRARLPVPPPGRVLPLKGLQRYLNI
jgi:hypothetical protein